MKNTITITVIISLLIILNISSSAIILEKRDTENEMQIKIIYIDANNIYGPWDGTINHPYKNINDGIQNSTEGDIIYVFNGTYYETLVINKKISIIGENNTNTTIDGSYAKEIIRIDHDNVNISNITIKNSGGYKNNSGIKINSDGDTIKNCIFYRTKTGIFINNTDNNLIDNCTFHTNAEGIFLTKTTKTKITGCILSHNSISINIYKSNNILIKYTYINSSSIAILTDTSHGVIIKNCNISDNSVNLGGIFLKNSQNIQIINNIIRHNGAGISISTSKNITIQKCNLNYNTHFAISFRNPSKKINVESCTIQNNFRYGIYVEKRNICKIQNCNITNNYLYSFYSEAAYCDIRHNYWGKLGPSFSELRPGSRIKWKHGIIRIIPWKTKTLNNIGANWTENKPYLKKKIKFNNDQKITIPGNDSDNDSIPDWWEEKWGYNPNKWDDHANLDPDGDALNNIEECYTDQYGSNPYHKDIFLEIDWMESKNIFKTNKPSIKSFEKTISNFAKQNITLHIDIDDEIPFCKTDSSYTKIREIYWDYFLENNLSNPRKGIYRYCIICKYCPDLNFPFIGWDNLDFIVISADWLKQVKPFTKKEKLIVGATIHHLGHTLGLIADKYNGIDNTGTINPFSVQWWKYRNYKSSMNYFYKYCIFTYSDGTHGSGDFNDWDNLDFSFFKNTHFELPKNNSF